MRRHLLTLIILAAFASRTEAAISEHDAAVHNLAHYGAGCIAFQGTALFCKVYGIEKKFPVLAGCLEIGAPIVAGLFKEFVDQENGGEFNLSQAASASVAGPLMFILTRSY